MRFTPKSIPQEEKKDDEHEVWATMTPMAWHNSVASKDSIFYETYDQTRKQISDMCVIDQHDCIVEVGCGTGDIIGLINVDNGATTVPRFGLDINPDFIDFCKDQYPQDHCTFLLQDATTVVDWWNKNGFGDKYKQPLVICVNNTLNIMPEDIRGTVISQMLAIAGENGRCLVSYWNGNFFSHAVMNYYCKNEDLCGEIELYDHVQWDKRTLISSTNYSTTWHTPIEVRKLLRAYDVDLEVTSAEPLYNQDHMNIAGLGIFAWFSTKCTSLAKGYYDSDDAQKFYKSIWGHETIHIGRYDKLTDQEKAELSLSQQISKAQEHQETEFIQLIKSKIPDSKVRVLDMGCGFGGLLRRLWEADLIWSATGVDIAVKMCQQARRLNHELQCDQDISIEEESYLETSVADESVDLVISMDALLHVGPQGQRKAVKEAARVLRPGGWMIFTDIMQQEQVDPVEMQPIYDRIHLSELGTVSKYQEGMEEVGFRHFEFLPASSNVSDHYGTILHVLEEKGHELGISNEYQEKMKAGLQTWRDLAPKNIVWGFMLAQKTVKVDL